MMLKVRGLHAGYGQSQVLFDVGFDVGAGEVVTLLGRNGMGKTTTISALMGIVSPTAGTIEFAGKTIAGLPSYRIAQRGLGLVPEGRQVFPNLTVRENLVATAANRSGTSKPWDLAAILAMFPRLGERIDNPAALLSGGEQQMMVIGRALMTNPHLLILDEATEGLAPLIRSEIWTCLARLKAAGQSILVVDKNVAALSRIADRHYILEKGRVAWSGNSAALMADTTLSRRYLGV
jgi:branched-chain amino acid transport system ATP-binding protein